MTSGTRNRTLVDTSSRNEGWRAASAQSMLGSADALPGTVRASSHSVGSVTILSFPLWQAHDIRVTMSSLTGRRERHPGRLRPALLASVEHLLTELRR